jgi:pimeloyl-ACP methyl ester carboxylesterase
MVRGAVGQSDASCSGPCGGSVVGIFVWRRLQSGGGRPGHGLDGDTDIAVVSRAINGRAASAGLFVPWRARAFFSRGIDRLTERLEEAGVTANVYEFTICRLIAAQAIREYREDPQPIVLIGHSMGGLCAVTFAEVLEGEGIRADLVVAIDPAHATSDVPLNVDRFINIFLSKSVLGGGDVKPKPGFRGHYASFDLSLHDEVSHINIEKMDALHQQLVAKVLQLAAARAEGDTAPIRYAVPAKAPVELWDSGTSVFARPGDSLQSIATAYHVPLWSVTQINKGAERAPLVPGERVIVPRHLEPPVEVSEPVPPKH